MFIFRLIIIVITIILFPFSLSLCVCATVCAFHFSFFYFCTRLTHIANAQPNEMKWNEIEKFPFAAKQNMVGFF